MSVFLALNNGEIIYTDTMAFKAIGGTVHFCHYQNDHIWSPLYGGMAPWFSKFNFYTEPQNVTSKVEVTTKLSLNRTWRDA